MNCILHVRHEPIPAELELHHVFPVGWGGPESGQRVPLCPTGHVNVHVLLRAMYHADQASRLVAWTVARHFGPTTRQLAQKGFDRWVAAGRPKVKL